MVAEATPEVRLALAVALIRARSSQSAALKHWKNKAKLRKKEINSLKQELQELQDEMASPMLAPAIFCKCHFFADKDHTSNEESNDVMNTIIFRRFHRILIASAFDTSKEKQLKITGDFLVELVGKGQNDVVFSTYAHQAVEFIKDVSPELMNKQKSDEKTAVSLLVRTVSRLLGKILSFSYDATRMEADTRPWIQCILRKMGTLSLVGHRVLLLASQKSIIIAEGLLTIDPFESSAAQVYDNIFIVLKLIEELISYQSTYWAKDSYFDANMLEEWINGYIQMRNVFLNLGDRNSVFLIYIERVSVAQINQLHQMSTIQELKGCCENALIKISCTSQL